MNTLHPIHHPSEHLIAEFAAGSLSFGPALCVSTHLEQCLECASLADNFALLGAALIQEGENIEVSGDLFERVLGQIGTQSVTPFDKQSVVTAPRNGALHGLLPKSLESLPWKSLAGGVSSYTLNTGDDDHSVKLLRVSRGRGVFTHTHTATEFTVLLRGGYSDELGNFNAGDFVECNTNHRHAPLAHRDQDCYLLTAVEGSLKFTGLLTRLANPFFRF